MSVNDKFPGLPDYVGPTKGYFTLLHHLGPVFEYSASVMERVEYVKKNKPAHEIETRLRHMVYVGLTRPAVWVESERVWAQAWAEYERVAEQALAEYGRVAKRAWVESERVWEQATKAVTAYLADLIPDCKWNGNEIVFPSEESR